MLVFVHPMDLVTASGSSVGDHSRSSKAGQSKKLQTLLALTVAGLIAGGFGAASASAASAPSFSALPASGNTELQTGRWDAGAATPPNGQVLIAGGNGSENNSSILASAELFNPLTDTRSEEHT